MKKSLVSVIIPSKNSAKYLRRCLDSVFSQSYPNIEVIVVDNYSEDETQSIAEGFKGVRYVKKGNERAAQTNEGIKYAKGEYIYRIDSDFILEENVIKEAVEACEKQDFDGVAVHNTSAPGLGFWASVRKLERDTYRDDRLIVGVRFFKQSAIQKLNGYNEDVIWDDYDIHNRFEDAGFIWGRIQSCELHLGEPVSLAQIIRKSFFYGKEMVVYLQRHPKRGMKQANPIRGSYFRHWKSFILHPVLTIGFIVMQFAKYISGVIGLLYGFITMKRSV